MVNLQLPNIKGDNEREQLKQMQRYLYQLVEQLQFALDTVSVSESPSPVKSQMPVRVIQSSPVAMMSLDRGLSDDQVTFQAIKPLIIKSADIVNAYYEEINKRLESLYVAQSDFGKFIEQNSQVIEATATDVTQRFNNIQVVITDLDTNIGSVRGDLQAVGEVVSYTQRDINNINESIETIDSYVVQIGGSVSELDEEVKAVGETVGAIDSELKAVGENVGALDTNLKSVETDLQDTKVGVDSSIDRISDELGVIDSDLQGVKAGVESNIKDLSEEVGKVDSKIDDAKSAIGSGIDKLKNSLDTLNSIVVDVNASIKSGLLYYDNDIPVYGIEVGQTNTINGVEVFNKFARFCAGRLSFYDQNGTEVAYISDYKLYITHAEVTGTLKLGGYLVDTSKGVTFKWVGRS